MSFKVTRLGSRSQRERTRKLSSFTTWNRSATEHIVVHPVVQLAVHTGGHNFHNRQKLQVRTIFGYHIYHVEYLIT